MRNMVLSMAAALTIVVMSGPAFAFLDDNSCRGNHNCNNTINDNSVVNRGGNGGAGGNANVGNVGNHSGNSTNTIGVGVESTNRNVNRNNVDVENNVRNNIDNSNRNANANLQGQDQDQSQRQGQRQGQGQSQVGINDQGQNQSTDNANNSSQSVNVEGDTYEAPDIPAATAYAPGLAAADDTCMGSTSAGFQGMSFGVSFGSTWRDEDCVRRKDSRELFHMGFREAALARMCQNDDNRKALNDAGMKCPGHDAETAQIEPVQTNDEQTASIEVEISTTEKVRFGREHR